jgi:hypothetical protein
MCEPEFGSITPSCTPPVRGTIPPALPALRAPRTVPLAKGDSLVQPERSNANETGGAGSPNVLQHVTANRHA